MKPSLLLVFCAVLSLVEVDSQTLTFPYVLFMNQTLTNHSYVDISRVGSHHNGRDSVQCHTDLSTCCTPNEGVHNGDWYFPDGSSPLSSVYGRFTVERSAQQIDLRRYVNVLHPSGIYCCEVSTAALSPQSEHSVRGRVYVGLYPRNEGNFKI